MTDPPYAHGRHHRPGGYDPTSTGPWHEIADGLETAWDIGTTYAAGDLVSHTNINWRATAASTAVEPGISDDWGLYWQYVESVFQNDWVNIGGDEETYAFKLVVGRPGGGAETIDDTKTSMEFKGAIQGGLLCTVVFTLPPGYRPPKNRRYAGSDEYGGFAVYTATPNGDVYKGIP